MKDRIATIGMMLARVGLLGSVVLGIGMNYGGWNVLHPHMLVGFIVMLGIAIVGVRYTLLEVKVVPIWIGLLLLVVGMLMALGVVPSPRSEIHAVMMILGFGLSEMGNSKGRKALAKAA